MTKREKPGGFQKYLIEIGACKEAVDWVGNQTRAHAWKTCERGDWMIWLLVNKGKTADKILRLIAADCAERVLPIFEKQYPGDDRPRKAILAARDYANGKIGAASMAAAGAASIAAAGAASMASAWAAAGASMAAAGAAMTAAWDSTRDARAAAEAAENKAQAKIIRKYIKKI